MYSGYSESGQEPITLDGLLIWHFYERNSLDRVQFRGSFFSVIHCVAQFTPLHACVSIHIGLHRQFVSGRATTLNEENVKFHCPLDPANACILNFFTEKLLLRLEIDIEFLRN